MTDVNSIRFLIEKLEEAREGSKGLDLEIFDAVHDGEWRPFSPRAKTLRFFERKTTRPILYGRRFVPAYTTSLDAALALVPPHHLWEVRRGFLFRATVWRLGDEYGEDGREVPHWQTEVSAPLAICVAAIKARLSLLERETT
jgi:hypothetical protein